MRRHPYRPHRKGPVLPCRAYPALVQAFAAYYGGDCTWCNREDDARDKGLRTSKLQYLPDHLGGKVRIEAGTELDALKAVAIPAVEVHISAVETREDFRQVSYARLACFATITGEGLQGYAHALELLKEHLLH